MSLLRRAVVILQGWACALGRASLRAEGSLEAGKWGEGHKAVGHRGRGHSAEEG